MGSQETGGQKQTGIWALAKAAAGCGDRLWPLLVIEAKETRSRWGKSQGQGWGQNECRKQHSDVTDYRPCRLWGQQFNSWKPALLRLRSQGEAPALAALSASILFVSFTRLNKYLPVLSSRLLQHCCLGRRISKTAH